MTFNPLTTNESSNVMQAKAFSFSSFLSVIRTSVISTGASC